MAHKTRFEKNFSWKKVLFEKIQTLFIMHYFGIYAQKVKHENDEFLKLEDK